MRALPENITRGQNSDRACEDSFKNKEAFGKKIIMKSWMDKILLNVLA